MSYTFNRLLTGVSFAEADARTRKALVFDPVKEQFIGDDAPSKMLRREYREHWARPVGA